MWHCMGGRRSDPGRDMINQPEKLSRNRRMIKCRSSPVHVIQSHRVDDLPEPAMDRHVARSERCRGTIDFESSGDYARRSYDQGRRPFQQSSSKTRCRGVEITHDRCPSGKRTRLRRPSEGIGYVLRIVAAGFESQSHLEAWSQLGQRAVERIIQVLLIELEDQACDSNG